MAGGSEIFVEETIAPTPGEGAIEIVERKGLARSVIS